jgi:hypothetical protein
MRAAAAEVAVTTRSGRHAAMASSTGDVSHDGFPHVALREATNRVPPVEPGRHQLLVVQHPHLCSPPQRVHVQPVGP